MLINLDEKKLGHTSFNKSTALALTGLSLGVSMISAKTQTNNANQAIVAHADETNTQNDNLSAETQAQIKNQYGFDAVKAHTNADKSLTLIDKDGATLTISNQKITNEVNDKTAETDNDDPDKYLQSDVEDSTNTTDSQQGNGQTNQSGTTDKNTDLNLPSDLSSIRQKIVDLAKSQLGVPYVWGGTSWGKGMDCSGFVQQVYKQVGVNLPRTSQQQSSLLKDVSLDQAKPGDLVYWGGKGSAYHIAIYVGNGKIIEEPNPSTPCHIVNLYGNYQIGTLDGINK